MNRSRDESSSSSVSVASSNGGKSKRNKNNFNSKHPNPNTVEKVRMIMEQEGRSARNLVSWSIPLDSYGPSKGKTSKTKPLSLHRKPIQGRDDILVHNNRIQANRCNSGDISSKKHNNSSRRNSTGSRKPVNIRARYWAYLFENLRRAVDEIYATCEGDASVVECKEVLLILDNYHHEFKALIDWINLQKKLENTDIRDRPTSLAWEVRKSSPGRPRPKMMQRGITSGAPSGATISRCLNFSAPPDAAALATASAMYRSLTGRPAPSSVLLSGSFENKADSDKKSAPVATWADRVKGIKPQPVQITPEAKDDEPTSQTNREDEKLKNEDTSKSPVIDDDGVGWETVTSKNRQPKHPKNTKNFVEHKPPLPTFKNSDLSPKSVSSNPKSNPPTTALHSSSSYVNMVVDRIIGLEGMSSPPSGSSTVNAAKMVSTTPVRKSHSQETVGKSPVKKVKFRADTEKVNLQNGDHFQKDLKNADSPELPSSKNVVSAVLPEKIVRNGDIEEDKLTLKKLEEEEALLAQTLHAEHDASIAVAEQQERDLLRQIQEAKEQETPDIDTDCESARSSGGAKEIPFLEQPPQQKLEWAEFVARFEAEQAKELSWNDLVEEEELREPGRAVQMHEKLSSPSRKRTPAESRRKQEEKHRRAEQRRQRMHQEKTQRIHELTEKVQEVINWKNDLKKQQRDLLQSCHVEKLARAEEQRAMQLLHRKKKARVEDTKVNEIAFINELQEQNKRHEVLMRIEEHESRIQELGLERTRMQEMKSVKEEIVKERRRALEKERLDRIEELKVKRQEQIARIEQQKIEKDKEREKLAKERARDREMRLSARNAAQQEAVTELQKKIQLKHDESERRHQVQLEQRKEKALELSLGRFSSLNASSSVAPPPTSSTAGASSSTCTKTLSGTVNGVGDVKTTPGEIETDDKPIDDRYTPITNDCMNSPRSGQAHPDEEAKEDLSRIIERKKAMKKRLKKLRTRMSTRAELIFAVFHRGKEFLKKLENKTASNTASTKNKIVRLIKDVARVLANQKGSSGPWPTNRVSALDRALGEMNRTFEKLTSNASEQESFRISGGFEVLEELFSIFLKEDGTKDTDAKISILPDRPLANAALVFRNACRGSHENCVYVLYSGKLTSVVDLTLLQVTKNTSTSPTPRPNPSKKNDSNAVYDVASPALLSALSTVFYDLCQRPPTTEATSQVSMMTMTSSTNVHEAYLNRGLDVISYIVASGIIDVLSSYFKSIRHEVAPGSNMAGFVEHGLGFLESMTSFVALRNRLLLEAPVSSKQLKKVSDETDLGPTFERDSTQLLATLKHTDLMGILSVLYGLLLHGAPERPTTLRSASVNKNLSSMTSSKPKLIPEHTLSVAFAVLSVLNAVAETNLPLLQTSLATEGLSLAFRHICTYLLWYCVQRDHTELLHEVIRCVGHFTLDNRCNQDLVDSGAQPTVLQQLCTLPFSYFSNPPLMHILLPTLIACCHENNANLTVFEQEASASLLVEFIQTYLENDGDEKGDNNEKRDKKGNLPRSLTDIPQFSSQFLHQALHYLSAVHSDVISDNAQVTS